MTQEELSALLAPVLGSRRADEIIAKAVVDLGFDGTNLEMSQARLVLAKLSDAPGLVGAAARLVQAREHLVKEPRQTRPEPAVQRTQRRLR